MRREVQGPDLAQHLLDIAAREGEMVWDRQVVLGRMRLSLPLMFTSALAHRIKRGPLDPVEPNAWIVELLAHDEIRLYLRQGEHYSEAGRQYFVRPVTVGVKSLAEFELWRPLPRDLWWGAEFVCPFCGGLCAGTAVCTHLLARGSSVHDPYRSEELLFLINAMGERAFNSNVANASIEGLRIKLPRVHQECEWFRFAHWYVAGPDVVERLLRVLRNEREWCARLRDVPFPLAPSESRDDRGDPSRNG